MLLLLLLFNLKLKFLLWKTSGLFFALFILDKLIEVSELVILVASSGRPRVNDNINLHSFSRLPITLSLAHSSQCDFVWKHTSFPSSAPVKTITHSYQRHSRPHQTAGPLSPSPPPPGEQCSHNAGRMANSSTLTLQVSHSASNLNLDLSLTHSLSDFSVLRNVTKSHTISYTLSW